MGSSHGKDDTRLAPRTNHTVDGSVVIVRVVAAVVQVHRFILSKATSCTQVSDAYCTFSIITTWSRQTMPTRTRPWRDPNRRGNWRSQEQRGVEQSCFYKLKVLPDLIATILILLGMIFIYLLLWILLALCPPLGFRLRRPSRAIL
jgi:hypothetical protein